MAMKMKESRCIARSIFSINYMQHAGISKLFISKKDVKEMYTWPNLEREEAQCVDIIIINVVETFSLDQLTLVYAVT